MLELIIGIIILGVIGVLIRGAMLIVGDKQREFIKHKQEQVSGEETDGDDTRSKGKKKDS